MRRIVIELTLEELSKLEGNAIIQKIKTLEIIQFLREDPKEFAVICRIEFTDPDLTMEEFIDDDVIELQMLEHEKSGSYTYFLKSKPTTQLEPHFDPFSPGGYLSVPFEIRDGMARITYLGDGRQIKLFLEQIEKAGIRYKVSSLSSAGFSHDSPLNRLTEKQRRGPGDGLQDGLLRPAEEGELAAARSNAESRELHPDKPQEEGREAPSRRDDRSAGLGRLIAVPKAPERSRTGAPGRTAQRRWL